MAKIIFFFKEHLRVIKAWVSRVTAWQFALLREAHHPEASDGECACPASR